jgi:hypothetical protein
MDLALTAPILAAKPDNPSLWPIFKQRNGSGDLTHPESPVSRIFEKLLRAPPNLIHFLTRYAQTINKQPIGEIGVTCES